MQGSQPTFEVQESVRNGRHTLLLSGELDLAVAAGLEAMILGLCGEGVSAVELDLSQLTFMDSSGLRAVLRCPGAMCGAWIRLSRDTGQWAGAASARAHGHHRHPSPGRRPSQSPAGVDQRNEPDQPELSPPIRHCLRIAVTKIVFVASRSMGIRWLAQGFRGRDCGLADRGQASASGRSSVSGMRGHLRWLRRARSSPPSAP